MDQTSIDAVEEFKPMGLDGSTSRPGSTRGGLD
jgi:hypothetical protein